MDTHSHNTILTPLCCKVDQLKLHIDILKCVKNNKPESLAIIKELNRKRCQMIEDIEKLQHLLEEQKTMNKKVEVLQVEMSHSIYKLDRLEELIKAKQTSEFNGCESITDDVCPQQAQPNLGRDLQVDPTFYELSPLVLNPVPPTNYKGSNVKPNCKLRFDINHLTVEEYKTIPKYMVGRLSLDEINRFIDVVNEARSKKYNILSRSQSSLKPHDLNLYRIFKSQNSKVKGRDFVTEEDIAREFGKRILEKKAHTFLTILRHTKRLGREMVDGLVAYVVSNS